MLIDWLWSGWTGKYLALDHDARTSLRSVRMSWPPTKYFFRALRLDNFHYFLFPVWEFLFSRTKKKHQVFYFTHSSSGSSPTTALVTMVTNVMTTSQIFFSVRYVWTIFIIFYFLFGSGYSREQKKQKKKTGFLLHSFVIRFISNHRTSYHGYKRMSHL